MIKPELVNGQVKVNPADLRIVGRSYRGYWIIEEPYVDSQVYDALGWYMGIHYNPEAAIDRMLMRITEE